MIFMNLNVIKHFALTLGITAVVSLPLEYLSWYRHSVLGQFLALLVIVLPVQEAVRVRCYSKEKR